MKSKLAILLPLLAAGCATSHARLHYSVQSATNIDGWLDRRGPTQTGASLESGLIDSVELGGDGHLWTFDLRGRGTPVISNGRVFFIGYSGEGRDLMEALVCLDEESGKEQWRVSFSDFLSDTVYDRYSISSPTIDPETGNLIIMTTPGLLCSFSPDGELLWEHSLFAELGRITFPNGRTGAAVIDGDLAIIHIITANWGPNTPARDRFYAFDKTTGECVWSTTPGEGPKDSPYSHPVLEWRHGKRLLYAGTGCGNVVCLNARTGELQWRFKAATGGVNSSPVIHGDSLIALHARENVDSTTIGRMVSIDLNTKPGADGPTMLGPGDEEWRCDVGAFTSSPVLVGDRIYQTVQTGELHCINADTGEVLWHEKLAPDQIHASPAYGDGKLYVPMNNGMFYIVRPSDEGPEVLSAIQLEGNCLGAPAIWNGRIYVHTTERLYCFGSSGGTVVASPRRAAGPKAGELAQLQLIPADFLMRVGETIPLNVRGLDAAGIKVADNVAAEFKGAPLVEVVEGENGRMLRALSPGIGGVTATAGNATGKLRVRVVPDMPLIHDFESIELTEGSGPAPSQWVGSGKWEVLERDGSKVAGKKLNNPILQRSTSPLGYPSMSNYTVSVDVMTDGNRRIMSSAGVVNQRYLIYLDGNYQEIFITSNDERIFESVPFKWKPKIWYTLKTRVDIAPDGSGVVRAKAWQRDGAEPEEWAIEVEHKHAHKNGSPALWGFTPQSRFMVYVDNISVTPNE